MWTILKLFFKKSTLKEGDYLSGPDLIIWGYLIWVLGSETEEIRNSKCGRDLAHEKFSCWLWDAGITGQGMLMVPGNWVAPSREPARKQGPHPYNCKELSMADNLNFPGRGFFPRISRKKHNPANILISVFRTWGENQTASYLAFWSIKLWTNK